MNENYEILAKHFEITSYYEKTKIRQFLAFFTPRCYFMDNLHISNILNIRKNIMDY